MPNRYKEERNRVIVGLYADGKGLTQKEIAARMGMKESAVSMVVLRERRREAEKEDVTDDND